jgi:hypothetical protein
MNTYVVFYNRRKLVFKAETSLEAQTIAAAAFKLKPKNAYKVAVVLAESNGQAVAVNPATL